MIMIAELPYLLHDQHGVPCHLDVLHAQLLGSLQCAP